MKPELKESLPKYWSLLNWDVDWNFSFHSLLEIQEHEGMGPTIISAKPLSPGSTRVVGSFFYSLIYSHVFFSFCRVNLFASYIFYLEDNAVYQQGRALRKGHSQLC